MSKRKIDSLGCGAVTDISPIAATLQKKGSDAAAVTAISPGDDSVPPSTRCASNPCIKTEQVSKVLAQLCSMHGTAVHAVADIQETSALEAVAIFIGNSLDNAKAAAPALIHASQAACFLVDSVQTICRCWQLLLSLLQNIELFSSS